MAPLAQGCVFKLVQKGPCDETFPDDPPCTRCGQCGEYVAPSLRRERRDATNALYALCWVDALVNAPLWENNLLGATLGATLGRMDCAKDCDLGMVFDVTNPEVHQFTRGWREVFTSPPEITFFQTRLVRRKHRQSRRIALRRRNRR
jgi:hypothetical protein